SGFALVLALLGGLLVAWPALAEDELFVGNAGRNSVTVYGRIANGDMAPVRTLSGAATGLSFIQNLAVDVANNELFVAVGSGPQGPAIHVYRLNANGNEAPIRTLTGAATGMSPPPIVLALDTTNNELFVANSNQTINVYSRTAIDNTAPLR